jgi:hypothetical protein
MIADLAVLTFRTQGTPFGPTYSRALEKPDGGAVGRPRSPVLCVDDAL